MNKINEGVFKTNFPINTVIQSYLVSCGELANKMKNTNGNVKPYLKFIEAVMKLEAYVKNKEHKKE